MAPLTDYNVERLSLLMQLVDRKIMRSFYAGSRFGLTTLQFHVLHLLHDSPEGLSMTSIAKILGISKPNVSPLITALVDKGYAERSTSGDDRRVITAVITPSGIKFIETANRSLRKHVEKILRHMDEEKVRALLAAVDNCVNIMMSLDEG